MAQPTQSDVHVDAVLTGLSVAYMQAQKSFIASRVFPVVPVDKQSDKYFTYTKADWFRDEAQRRADASESAGSGYNQSTDNYSCDVFALHKDIGNQARANADAPLDLERDAAQFVTQRMLLRREIQWVTDYFATGVWDTDKVGTTDFVKWSTYATSDPIGDIESGKETMLKNTGFEPNKLVLGYEVFRILKHHPDVVDRFKYVNAESITEAMLAQLFGVEEVLVAKAIKNTAVEGETASYSFTHGKNAGLFYAPPRPSLLTPSAGYVFVWRGVSQGLGENIGVTRFEIPTKKAVRVEAEIAWDNKKVASDLGYFFSTAV